MIDTTESAASSAPVVVGLVAVCCALMLGYSPTWGLRGPEGARLLCLAWGGLLGLYLGTVRNDQPNIQWLAWPLGAGALLLLIDGRNFGGRVALTMLVGAGLAGWLGYRHLAASVRPVLEQSNVRVALAGLGLMLMGQLALPTESTPTAICGAVPALLALLAGPRVRRPALLVLGGAALLTMWMSWFNFSTLQPVQGSTFSNFKEGLYAPACWLWYGCFPLAASYLWDAFQAHEPPLRWRWARFGLLLLLAFAIKLATLSIWNGPKGDFAIVTTHGCELLASGTNPYGHVQYLRGPLPIQWGYIPELVYTCEYPPGTLYELLPAWRLLGDVRYAYVLVDAAVVVLWLILTGRAREPSAGTQAIIMMYLFTPSSTHMLAEGWTDPLLFLWLTVAVWLWSKQRLRGVAGILGLALATKHQAVTMLLPAWRMLRARPGLGGWVVAAALIPCLPFLYLNAFEFIAEMTVTLHMGPRLDAQNLSNYLQGCHVPFTPGGISVVSMLMVVGLLSGQRRTVYGYTLGVTMVSFTLYFFAKWAFVNYYWFVNASLLLTLLVAASAPSLAAAPMVPATTRS